jgi:hypothetical protein
MRGSLYPTLWCSDSSGERSSETRPFTPVPGAMDMVDRSHFNLEFRPALYLDDPISGVLDELPENLRGLAVELTQLGRKEDLLNLLIREGIVGPGGVQIEGGADLQGSTLDELSGEPLTLATLGQDYGYNELVARKVGWEVNYVLVTDGGYETYLDSGAFPPSFGELIGLIEFSGLLDELRDGAEHEDPEELEGRWIWSSGNEITYDFEATRSGHWGPIIGEPFYPELERYFLLEEAEWLRSRTSDDDED